MRELTKKQKIKVLNEMLKMVNGNDGLCSIYYYAMDDLNYYSGIPKFWTPRFIELNNKIVSEIKRTGGCFKVFIRYKNWKQGRIKLLKELKKEL